LNAPLYNTDNKDKETKKRNDERKKERKDERKKQAEISLQKSEKSCDINLRIILPRSCLLILIF
jgi:hypothetical protein